MKDADLQQMILQTTRAAMEEMHAELRAELRADFKEDLESSIGRVIRRLDDVEAKLDRQDRRISAIESFPVPYGRPAKRHSATEEDSVSRAKRRPQSHYG